MATNTTNNQYKAKIYLTYSQGTNSYNFAFDYISKYYVKVRINNNDELTYGTHYTVVDKTVTLNSVVTLSEGDLIEIFRETPTDKTIEWYDSSILRAQDLNLFNVQLMHINEENTDKLLDSGMQEDKLDSKWDARLKQIKNLPNPTEDDEAINYGFLKSTQNGYLQASQAKVDEANNKAKDAMIQANRAYEQAENAKQNSTNAYNEANRAYSEAERAKGYADIAKTSEDNVSTMKTSVEATKMEVDNIKKAVETTKTEAVNDIKNAQEVATADVESHRASAVNDIKNAQEVATADVESHRASAVTAINGYKTEVASYRDATATSATNAANSATDAATKASQASTSATSAANSATNATKSATEAANSATEAKTYKDQAKAIVSGDFLTKLDASKTYATITDMNTNASNITALQTSDNAKFKAVSVSNDTLTFTKGDNTTTAVTVNNVANAMNATKLSTARTIQTNLASTSSASFDGSANVAPGVTGILPVANGGTGVSSLDNITVGRATSDASGNNINSTYVKKAGDTVTGTLNVPTQDTTDNSTKVANTAFVQSAISQLVNSAPATLDTLNELANALGNDPNFATTVTKMISQKADKTAVDNIVNVMYPVGIIVEFAADVDPNTTWVGTTWERMSSGRVLVSAGQYNETNWGHIYALGETGGEAQHTLTTAEMPSHSHSGTTDTNGNHTHTLHKGNSGSGGAYFSQGQVYGAASGTVTPPEIAGNHTHAITVSNTGGGLAHNNMQPYEVVNRWKRTA